MTKHEMLLIQTQILRMATSVIAVMQAPKEKTKKVVKKQIEKFRNEFGQIVKPEFRDMFNEILDEAMQIHGID